MEFQEDDKKENNQFILLILCLSQFGRIWEY